MARWQEVISELHDCGRADDFCFPPVHPTIVPYVASLSHQFLIPNSEFLISASVPPMPQFIYTMKGLGKVHPPDNRVLDDIWLSFYYGAKIGVLGLNGAGKSSLLRIMSGEDQTFLGEAMPAQGISIGFLQQEPRLNAEKTVLGNVEEGVAPIKALLQRYDDLNARLGEDLPPAEMDKVMDEQSKVQDQIDATNAWD